ncbi:histidine phosphatase family protein [bacterium]|nr:histidine phosphatase family protein [bacterium]
MYFNRKCKITFICHGATIYSEEGRFSDAENYPPLSELGVEEMDSLTKYLKARGVKNDVIYTSPSLRTVQSAMMIAKVFKKDYVILDDLKTRACGKWNGLTFGQILEKYPTGFRDILRYPDKITQADAESSIEFIKRVKVIIDKLVEENVGNRIIIVTHPDVIQAAICAALDIPADKLPKIFIRTGSATQISYYEEWASLVYSDYVPL